METARQNSNTRQSKFIFLRARKIRTGPGDQGCHAEFGENDTDASAEKCKQNTFREKVPQQLGARGTECRAYRGFPPISRGPSQQQISDVGTRDQEYKTDRSR
jgi:hypothetical protein